MSDRKPNTQECIYAGRKLSNINTDIESTFQGICVGSERDDEIYAYDENILKERVVIYIDDCVDGEGYMDLEDVLRFAAKYCRGIYDRVASEEIQIEEGR